jgi:hypothetical protein
MTFPPEDHSSSTAAAIADSGLVDASLERQFLPWLDE